MTKQNPDPDPATFLEGNSCNRCNSCMITTELQRRRSTHTTHTHIYTDTRNTVTQHSLHSHFVNCELWVIYRVVCNSRTYYTCILYTVYMYVCCYSCYRLLHVVRVIPSYPKTRTLVHWFVDLMTVNLSMESSQWSLGRRLAVAQFCHSLVCASLEIQIWWKWGCVLFAAAGYGRSNQHQPVLLGLCSVPRHFAGLGAGEVQLARK